MIKSLIFWQYSSVQLVSHVQLFVIPQPAASQSSLSITNSRSLLKLMSIKSVMLSNHLIYYHPLLHLPSIFPSIRVFSNESVLHIRWPSIRASAFFMVQLSHPYMTTGQTIALTIQTFVSNVSLLFNMLSRLVIASLPRSKCPLISWLQSWSVILESQIWSPRFCDFGAQENKVSHCFHCFFIYLPWSDGTKCQDLHFLNVECI